MAGIERLRDSCRVSANVMVNLLVHGEYEVLVSGRPRSRYTAGELAAIVSSYPDRLIEIPPDIFETLTVHHDLGSDPATFHMAIRLWTEREGRSRLVLRMDFIDSPEHPVVVDEEILTLQVEDPSDPVTVLPRAE